MVKEIWIRSIAVAAVCAMTVLFAEPQAWCATTVYVQTNLVSDIPGLAQSTDPNLKNPWGLAGSATSPFWAGDAATNKSTLYSGTGSTVSATVVTVPGGPTGVLPNPTTTDFAVPALPATRWIFATLDGSIYAYTGSTVAAKAAALPNASFTGLATANNGAGNYLYAANIVGTGSIEVFDTTYAHVTLAGTFKDPNLPSSVAFGSTYVPYNVQNINGQLYVEYANFKLNTGAVAVFDANGNFIKELIPAGGPQLNQPWGVTIAPAGFGDFAGDLLVGNFGNGKINAFDPVTGAFHGTLSNFNGPIVIPGLWALTVRTGGTFNTTGVYFSAGINNQADGLLGILTAATPATVAITTSSLPNGKVGTSYSQILAATGGTPPYANFTLATGSLPPGLTLDSTGKISGTPTAVSGTFSFTVSLSDSTGAKGASSFQLTVQPAAAASSLSRIGSFAQVVSGGGWKSTLTLINLTATPVNAQVNIYADDGTPAVVPMTFPQYGSANTLSSSASVTVGPNDSVVVQSNASSPTVGVGWADVLASGALSGYLTVESNSPGQPNSEATVPLDARLSNSLVLPYDNTNGAQTGLAVANQSSTAQTITATVFDQNGVQLGTTQLNLKPFGHASFFLSGQFAKSANQLGIVQFQSAAGVTGIGLLMSPTGVFTSIPIIR